MIYIDHDRCTGCGACVEACPNDAIEIQDGFAHVLAERCTNCGVCAEVCPQGAVLLLPEPRLQEQTIAKPEGQPVDRSQEIITVRVPPPPTLAPARPAPARQLGLALVATLSFLGREVAPRLVRLAVDWVEDRVRAPQGPSSEVTRRKSAPDSGTRPGARGGRGKRRRQRRGQR